MKQKLLILLFTFLGFTTTFASFPVTENGSINEISLSVEDPDISKSEKILWFALGLLGTIYGLGASIIYQLITQKKGPIKYALYGLLTFAVLAVILLIIFLAGYGGFDFNPFILS
ncbi:MAG: hypothetical protein HOG85_00580 [Flavobacteriales bacterium]|nr:hypothetical protein [Flavobacteriales bacterium]